jgi:hypothetical protein
MPRSNRKESKKDERHRVYREFCEFMKMRYGIEIKPDTDEFWETYEQYRYEFEAEEDDDDYDDYDDYDDMYDEDTDSRGQYRG